VILRNRDGKERKWRRKKDKTLRNGLIFSGKDVGGRGDEAKIGDWKLIEEGLGFVIS
jgi:hypothetical protein